MFRRARRWLPFAALALLAAPPGPAAAQDDWSLTRPRDRRPRRERGRRPARERPAPRPAPRDRGASGEEAEALRRAALEERYLEALRRDPGQAFALERLVALNLRDHGDLDALVADLSADVAEETAPAAQGALRLVLGRVLIRRGDEAEARGHLEAAATLRPDDPAPRAALGRLVRGTDPAAAERWLDEALARTDAGPARTELLRELGGLALDRGDLEAARRRYAALARGADASVYLRTELARALEARDRHAEAAAEYRRVAGRLRGDARVVGPVLRDLGRAELGAGRIDEAIDALERALRVVGRASGVREEVLELLVDAHRRRGTLEPLVERLARRSDAGTVALVARLYDELQRDDEALAYYRRALARRPRDLDTRVRLIQLLMRSGRLDEVVREYEALVRAAPREPRFVVELAQLLMQTGRREEALRVAARTGRAHPRDAAVHAALAELYATWGEQELAAREVERLARIDPNDPAHLVALGSQRLAAGDRQGALAAWRRILDTETDRARALAAYGEVLADHDQLPDAVVAYEQAVALAPDVLEHVRGLASVQERLRRHDAAIRGWRRVLELAGDDRVARREARGRVVAILARSGRLERAARSWRAEFAADPPDVEAGRFLAEAHLRARPRQLAAAEEVLRRVVELEPGEVESLLALERVQTARGDLVGAIETLERLVDADPARAADHLQRMAEHALAAYRDDDAVRFAARAVALRPEDAGAHRRLGDLYRARQDPARAVASYQRAIALDPRQFSTFFDLAEVHLARGELAAADRLLRRLLRGAPDDDLVLRAARAAIQVNLGLGTLEDLETALLPLALAHPQRPVFRRAVVELYAALVTPWIRAVEGGGAGAEEARGKLAALGGRGLKPLLEALAGPDPDQRRIALDVLAHVDAPAAAVPLLAAAEGEGEATLRARAVVAAGAVGGPELAGRLAALAEGPERRLRAAATWALGAVGGARARQALRRLVEATDKAVRIQAALALGSLPDPGAERHLVDRLASDRHPLVRAAAAWALGGLPGAAGRATGSLVVALRGRDPLLQRAAASTLGGLRSREASAALAAAAAGMDPHARSAAAAALRAPGARSSAPLPLPRDPSALGQAYLRGLLDLPDPSRLPPPDLGPYLDALAEAVDQALRGPPEHVATALDLLSGDGRLALGPLTAGRDAWPPEAAAAVAAELRDLGEAVGPAVARAVAHVDARIRAAAVRVLALVGGAGVWPAVESALGDPVVEVRLAALDAAVRLGEDSDPVPGVVAAVVALLADDPGWSTRMRAARALGSLGAAAAAGPLAEALAGDDYAFVREAAAAALDPGWPGARGALSAAREADPEPRVRAAASERLAGAGGSIR